MEIFQITINSESLFDDVQTTCWFAEIIGDQAHKSDVDKKSAS